MFHDFCQSVTLVFCQRTHVSHDHHPRGPCCSRARISYDEPCMGAIFYQKIFASALIFGCSVAALRQTGSRRGFSLTCAAYASPTPRLTHVCASPSLSSADTVQLDPSGRQRT